MNVQFPRFKWKHRREFISIFSWEPATLAMTRPKYKISHFIITEKKFRCFNSVFDFMARNYGHWMSILKLATFRYLIIQFHLPRRSRKRYEIMQKEKSISSGLHGNLTRCIICFGRTWSRSSHLKEANGPFVAHHEDNRSERSIN